MLQKLLRYGRNFYVATGLGLLAWMTFFDAMIYQRRLATGGNSES